MNSTWATVVWLMAKMKLAEATAVEDATASPAQPIDRNTTSRRPAVGAHGVGAQRQRGEERAAGQLGLHVQGQLALQDAGARPGDRRQCHRCLAAPVLADAGQPGQDAWTSASGAIGDTGRPSNSVPSTTTVLVRSTDGSARISQIRCSSARVDSARTFSIRLSSPAM